MIVEIKIEKCTDCRHAGHSGAFTPGGAIYVCDHREAPRKEIKGVNDFRDVKTKEIAQSVFGQREIKSKIPSWCPLKAGFTY